jgi:hypothetical protein
MRPLLPFRRKHDNTDQKQNPRKRLFLSFGGFFCCFEPTFCSLLEAAVGRLLATRLLFTRKSGAGLHAWVCEVDMVCFYHSHLVQIETASSQKNSGKFFKDTSVGRVNDEVE